MKLFLILILINFVDLYRHHDIEQEKITDQYGFIFSNKSRMIYEEETMHTIMIPQKLIKDVLSDHTKFFPFDNYTIPINIYIKLFTYMINNDIYTKEITDQCRAFKHQPKTNCSLRLATITDEILTDFSRYVTYQSVVSPCRDSYIYPRINFPLFKLLSFSQQKVLLNTDISLIKKSLLKPLILLPQLSNIFILEYIVPCRLLNQYECKFKRQLQHAVAIIEHYKYGILSKICEQSYKYIFNSINRVKYFVIDEYVNEFNEIETLDSVKLIYHLKYSDYILQKGDRYFVYIKNKYHEYN